MFKEERRHAIINLLIKDNSVSVSKLSDLIRLARDYSFRSTLFPEIRYASALLWRRILNRDALSKLITENKIDISSTIATPIHQDAKLRRENTKKQARCVF